MDKDKKIVVFEDEDGNEMRLEMVKEFNFKGNDYAVLFSDDKCECEDDCDCDDDCSDDSIYILRMNKNDKDETSFEEIEDKKLLDELINEAEKLLYEDK